MAYTRGHQLYLARRKATLLYNQACRERDERGMRENLGYDSARDLHDYMETLNLLTWADKCQIAGEYFHLCGTIYPA